MEREIYIVLSQTGTWLSRALKLITRAEYNHASISLSPDLTQMYSFGRLNPYNPFLAGFVQESPHFGTFKRFSNTKIVVLTVKISQERFDALEHLLNAMMKTPRAYHYNYLGLWLAAFRICRKKRNCYYCSEFVKELLQRCGVKGSESLRPIVQPIHFLSLPYPQVYQGKLTDFRCVESL